MDRYNIQTIKAALLYILNEVPDDKHSIYFIVKAAFYAQERHLAKWGTPMMEDDICALPFGPVPSKVYDILKGARGEQNLTDTRLIDAAKSIRYSNEEFFAMETPDMGYLSKAAIECLNAAIQIIREKSFSDILDTTHESAEYKRARLRTGRRIMDPVRIAEDAGADDYILEYLQDYYEIKAALG